MRIGGIKLKKYLDYISDAIVQFRMVKNESGNRDIKVIYANKQTESIIGRPLEDVLYKNVTEVFPEIMGSIFDWPKILSEAAMTSDYKVIEQYVTGFEKYIRFNVFGLEDSTFYVAMQDMTEEKEMKRRLLEMEREIKHLENDLKSRANVDMLTKLYNFQFLNECIKSSILNYKEEGINFCLLVLDIDDFKKMNMICGMNKADLILQDVAHILSSNARKIDVVGRYGNDKFMIILNNVDIDIAKVMTERIIDEIETYNTSLDYKLSVCGSIVEYAGESIEKFVEKSENLTTKAQSMGKGIILS